MNQNTSHNNSTALIGGVIIGLALGGACFYAGHAFWPQSGSATALTTIGGTVINPKTTVPPVGTVLAENTIADIAQMANQSVVNIDTKSSVTVSDAPMMGMQEFLFGGNSFRPQPRKLERAATGSGVIYRADGYILTNNHVVGNAQSIVVTLADKRKYDGKVVGRDRFTDLAIVKIDANDLPAAHLGQSKSLRVGDWALAIGSPLGFDHTVTLGIISALNREHIGNLAESQALNNVNLIQTDAAINPGNSGGPLLDIHGNVMGINTAIRGDAQNIGFAIPIDVARQTADELLAHGKIARAYVGVYMQDLDDKLAQSLGLPGGTKGVIVAKTAEGGPADQAGLQQGDLIKKVDGQSVASGNEVQAIVRKHKPGETVNFLIERDGQLSGVGVKIGDYPNGDEQQ
ncbi:MAG TPA: trypsin-like peptidase domain-containing protein [Planktothrix sp.]